MNNPIHDLNKLDAQIEQARVSLIELERKRNEFAKFLSSSEKSAKKAIRESVKR